MKLDNRSARLGVCSLALGSVLLLVQVRCKASLSRQQEHEQSQPQQQTQQPPPTPASPTAPPSSQPVSESAPPVGELPIKRRRVWTNDDLVSLRTPADNYQLEKEAKEAAEAQAAAEEAAAQAAPKSEQQPPSDIKLPATPEETEKMLKDTQGDIQEETDVLDRLHKELLNASADQQAEKQKEIDRMTASLATLQRDMKALQDHLQTLQEKRPGENPPAPPQPPSS
jgi:hypothetical protein